jgi:hypothetical protein
VEEGDGLGQCDNLLHYQTHQQQLGCGLFGQLIAPAKR